MVGSSRHTHRRRTGRLDREPGREESVRDAERQRLARDLHDGLVSTLYGISLRAEKLAELTQGDAAVAEVAAQVCGLASVARREIRAVIFGLRPEALGAGLTAALRELGTAVEAHQSLRVEVCCEGEMECSAEVQEAIYRIAQEALANVIRHARASSVSVDLGAGEDGRLVLEVADDGVGFDGCLEQPGHLGQRSMAERATALGGRLEVASRAGGGTTVRAEIPCMQPGGPSAQ